MIQLKMKQLLLSFAFIDSVAIVAIQRFYNSGLFVLFFFLKN